MSNYNQYFRKKFALEFIVWSIVYTVIIILLFLLFKITLSSKVYFGYELLYPFYHWANDNKAFLIFIVLSVGYAFIMLILFHKSISYMSEVITAIDEVFQKDDRVISLSGDLKDVTAKMNSIKFSLRENEKLAKDAEKRKNDLIIYLAHDLKTPLTSIIGYLTILMEENELSESFRHKFLKISHDKAVRLEDLINEFFEITRFNLNDIIIEKSNVHFSLMMEQIIYEFGPLLGEKNLTIHSNIEPEIKAEIDSNKLERVVDNIIRNAINYADENSEIRIDVWKDNGFIHMKVSNKGPTIPSAKVAHIFDEFFRLDSARSSKTGAAGLGLAIAKSIVVAHGGEIDAKSENELFEMNVKVPY